jgi:hypothetical protein
MAGKLLTHACVELLKYAPTRRINHQFPSEASSSQFQQRDQLSKLQLSISKFDTASAIPLQVYPSLHQTPSSNMAVEIMTETVDAPTVLESVEVPSVPELVEATSVPMTETVEATSVPMTETVEATSVTLASEVEATSVPMATEVEASSVQVPTESSVQVPAAEAEASSV